MAIQTPPTISPTPTPAIQRGDRTTFASRVDAFIQWLVAAVTQFNGSATATNANALDAQASAQTASIQAAAAVSGVNAQVWVSGTVYTAGQVRYSPTNGRTYRRLTNGDGTTDPGSNASQSSADPANWVLLSQRGATPVFHVREEVASGQSPLTSPVQNAYTTRAINTVKSNTITGAALASNQVTLPAGTYRFLISSPAQGLQGRHRAALYNVTDGVYAQLGQNATSSNANLLTTVSLVQGYMVLATAKTFEVRHYAPSTGAFGEPVGAAQAEVYLDALFWKED